MAAALVAASPAAADEATTAQGLEEACSRLLVSYATATDTNDLAGIVGSYADDGVLENVRAKVVGIDKIKEYFGARMTERVASGFSTRHIISNIEIAPVDATHAEGRAYETVYRFSTEGTRPAGSLEPILIGTITSRFVMTPTGCKFLVRKSEEALREY